MNGSAQASSGSMAQHEIRWRGYLDGMQSGQTESLAQLYDETSSMTYALALRVLSNQADAEEVVLDVYQQVWNSRHNFDATRGTVRAWLCMLTRSRAIDRLRGSGARQRREMPIEDDWQIPSPRAVPEAESIFREERKLVQKALETLSPPEREAIELAFFKGMTHVEVAETLRAPLGTIKTRIRVGLRKLRDVLAPGSAETIV